MNLHLLTLRVRGLLRTSRDSLDEPVGPVSALAHQLALSTCMVLGIVVVDDQGLGIPWLYWTGQTVVHLLTLALVLALLSSRTGRVSRRWTGHLMVVLPFVDLLVLAVCRWSVVNAGGFQGFLMAVPIVWLAARYRFRGVTIGVAFGVCSMVLGLLISPERAAIDLISRGLATTVLTGAVALVVAGAVARLEEQRRRLQTVSAALGVVSLVLGEEGELVEVDGRLGGIASGRAIPELLRDPVFADNGRTPLPPARNPLARAAGGAELDGAAVWVDLEDGRRIALSVSSTRLDEARMLVVVHDVTASLAAVLQEEQFLANVSHELKTPLTSISGYIELVEDEIAEEGGGDTETIRAHLHVVGRNVVRLQQLILGLLETARTVSADRVGSRTGAPRAIALDELVGQQLASIRPRADSRRLRWAVSGVDREVELLNADPERLGQALDNILSNAVKYAHEGGLITVELAVEGQAARLLVADEGIGIDQEDLQKLFTPYFRARTATESGVAGYGLGLMITRRIVRAHGGELTISSRVGRGTRVEMVIPLVRT